MDILTDTLKDEKISVGTRIGTMLLDHAIMSGVMMVFYLPFMISLFTSSMNNPKVVKPGMLAGGLGYLALFGFSLYFCKDIINGRSFAKRNFKLQIVDNSTGKSADPIKCFIRNIFCVIWPIEIIVGMINTNRRVGDFVAGTKLVQFDPSNESPKLNIGKIALTIGMSYGLSLLLGFALK